MAEEKKKEEKKGKRPTPLKRDLQSEKRRLHNKAFKASIKTAIRSFENHITNNDVEGAKMRLNEVYSLLDKGVKTHVYKLNKASRLKTQLTKHLPKA